MTRVRPRSDSEWMQLFDLDLSGFEPVNHLWPQMVERLGSDTSSRAVRQALDLFGMRGSPGLMPALLVETGFISNPSEARQLQTESYQKKMARAIFNGIRDYFYRHPPAGTMVAARQKAANTFVEYVVRKGDTLSELAVQNGMDVKALRDLNGLNSDSLRVGQRLRIPNS